LCEHGELISELTEVHIVVALHLIGLERTDDGHDVGEQAVMLECDGGKEFDLDDVLEEGVYLLHKEIGVRF
jgi:hypothetical protein